MKKMIRIEYFPYSYVSGNNMKFSLAEGNVPASTFIDIDTITTVATEPKTNDVYDYGAEWKYGCHVPKKMYPVGTNIGVGLGLNGIDFKKFWVTEETYNKLLSLIEIV